MQTIVNKTRDFSGHMESIHDMTRTTMLEDELKKELSILRQQNEHQENILKVLAHDLRSPLATIISIADYLKGNISTMQETEVNQMLKFLYDSSVKELNMLDYLLEWARIKEVAKFHTPVKLYVYEYVERVIETQSQSASNQSVKLISHVSETAKAYVDGKMLLSIFQNIISNAIKCSPSGGDIVISSFEYQDKIVIEIRDSGIGMSKEKQENLFKPQLANLTKAKKENGGGGFGLLLVKSFVEKNHGQVWIKSKEGIGTSFFISLPVNKPTC